MVEKRGRARGSAVWVFCVPDLGGLRGMLIGCALPLCHMEFGWNTKSVIELRVPHESEEIKCHRDLIHERLWGHKVNHI